MASNPPPTALLDLLKSHGLDVDPLTAQIAAPPSVQTLDRSDLLLADTDQALLAEFTALHAHPPEGWWAEIQTHLAQLFPSPIWSALAADLAAVKNWAQLRAEQVCPEGALQVDPLRFPGNRENLARAISAAQDSGKLVIVDEAASAFRLAAGAWSLGLATTPDFIILGPSLAAGRPFAALLAYSDRCGATPTDLPSPSLQCQAIALATLGRLLGQPVHADLARIGEQFRSTMLAGCRRNQLEIALTGPAAAMRFACQGQENATPEQIAHYFQLELRDQGLVTGGDLLPNLTMIGSAGEAIRAGIDHTCNRIRTLLIEHNSYLSGGIPYVFPGGDARLRERGLARYRYPKLADTRVEAVDDHLDITFAAGEMGEVTSSGFYLPTLVRGDLDVRLKYRVCVWDPGPDSSCLALFFQNVASTARYYSQRMSSGDASSPHSVISSLQAVLSEHRPVKGNVGEFRLTRKGKVLRAWHRSDEDDSWLLLATDQDACTDDFIIGAKIWSKDHAGDLKAELFELSIEGEVPEEQLPILEVRKDPREA